MNRLKKSVFILLIISVVLTMAGCGVEGEIRSYYGKVEEELRNSMYDPGSMIVESAVGVHREDDDYYYYYIRVNGKNRFGAYVGVQGFYYYYNKKTGLADECYGDRETLARFAITGAKMSEDSGTEAADGQYYVRIK